VTHTTLNWERTLAAAGKRVTRQREVVLDAVCAGGGHTSIGDIVARAKQVDGSIDLSTVYRALKVFTELGIVLTVPSGEGEQLFEIRHATPHHHLVCKTCGTELPLATRIADGMVEHIREEQGFAVELDHLVLWGMCRTCQNLEPARDRTVHKATN
jgi:Fur family transcriptional regulator, ferric uptake regulator